MPVALRGKLAAIKLLYWERTRRNGRAAQAGGEQDRLILSPAPRWSSSLEKPNRKRPGPELMGFRTRPGCTAALFDWARSGFRYVTLLQPIQIVLWRTIAVIRRPRESAQRDDIMAFESLRKLRLQGVHYRRYALP
jgi:hypothetical protein